MESTTSFMIILATMSCQSILGLLSFHHKKIDCGHGSKQDGVAISYLQKIANMYKKSKQINLVKAIPIMPTLMEQRFTYISAIHVHVHVYKESGFINILFRFLSLTEPTIPVIGTMIISPISTNGVRFSELPFNKHRFLDN